MSESEPTENDDMEAVPVADSNQARVVIDFTVGPAGVGPVTSVSPGGFRDGPPVPPPDE